MLWFFENIFAEKFGETIGFSPQIIADCEKIDHKIGFYERRHFFRPKYL
jgi:hypothetical protein